MSALSTRPFASKHANSPKNTSKDASGDPHIPVSSFADLGLSKTSKIFIIGTLAVFGTVETWFWCQTAWRWWKGGVEDGDQETESG